MHATLDVRPDDICMRPFQSLHVVEFRVTNIALGLEANVQPDSDSHPHSQMLENKLMWSISIHSCLASVVTCPFPFVKPRETGIRLHSPVANSLKAAWSFLTFQLGEGGRPRSERLRSIVKEKQPIMPSVLMFSFPSLMQAPSETMKPSRKDREHSPRMRCGDNLAFWGLRRHGDVCSRGFHSQTYILLFVVLAI